VCTDPAAKGPTGPLCLVHLQMLPVVLRRHPPRSWLDRIGSALLPCWVSRALTRSPSLCLGPRSASCLAAPGAELRRRSENQVTLRPQQPQCKRIAYDIRYGLTVRAAVLDLVHISDLPRRLRGSTVR
jgi:hypothetical protein